VLLPKREENEAGLFGMLKKWLGSKLKLGSRTDMASKCLSWIFEIMARCPHAFVFSAVFCEKILQIVGSLLAIAAGGPTTKRIMSVTETMRICVS
jgi:hypothetical protein